MITISRLWLTAITLIFGLFLDIMGLLHLNHFSSPLVAVATNISYLICLVITAVAFREPQLPIGAAMLNLFAVILIPIALNAVYIGELIGNNDTWYVTALAVLLGATAVRRQIFIAIAGTLILAIEIIVFGGWAFIPKSGLTGAILLVAACISISIGLERADKAIVDLQEQTNNEKREIMLTEAAREEHRIRIERAIEKVMPTLRLIADGTKLSKSQREAASELAQQLDDEISGGRLITEAIKNSVKNARARGIEVTLIDEVEADNLDRENFDALLEIVVSAIDSVNVGRIKLIAPKNGRYTLRLTATRPGVVTPDLDLKLGER